MANSTGLLVFTVDNVRLAIDLEHVDRVVRAASLSPLPGAPESILGILNLGGVPVPVLSLRRKLKLADREITTTDEIIVIKRHDVLMALIVDEVEDVSAAKEIMPLAEAAGLTILDGAARVESGIVLVQNIDRFLSAKEELSLSEALLQGVPQ